MTDEELARRTIFDSLLSQLSRVRRSGSGYVALCPAHDDRHHSLSVMQAEDRILMNCFRFPPCTIEAICKALHIQVRDLFGLAVNNPSTPWSGTKRREYARSIWHGSRTACGTVVEVYLRNRGITIPIPPAIRFAPSIKHREYGWSFPVLAAGIQDVTDRFAAVSLTWLSADGVNKAPTEPTRKIYGALRANAVRLRPASDIVAVCEGIETGLSIAQACPELSVWCALTATNLPNVAVPETVRTVIIAADADLAGEETARAAAQRFIREGRQVRIARLAKSGTDFNDLRL
jgi:hypothetical protein